MSRTKQKYTMTAAVAALFLCGFVYVDQYADQIMFGFNGQLKATMAVSPTGGLDIESRIPGAPSQITLWPSGIPATHDAVTESVMYGLATQVPGVGMTDWARCSQSMMAGTSQLRFSCERGGNGQFADIHICYDSFTPGTAYCPFRISPNPAIGVQVCDISDHCTRIGG